MLSLKEKFEILERLQFFVNIKSQTVIPIGISKDSINLDFVFVAQSYTFNATIKKSSY